MTPPSDHDAALAAARLHLQATHAALAAALRRHDGYDENEGPAGADGPPPAGSMPRPSLVMQLADQAVAPWAEERPWTLMAMAAGAGALLASRRGRGVLVSLAMAALLAPAAGRRGWPSLGAAGVGWLLRRRATPADRSTNPGPPR